MGLHMITSDYKTLLNSQPDPHQAASCLIDFSAKLGGKIVHVEIFVTAATIAVGIKTFTLPLNGDQAL